MCDNSNDECDSSRAIMAVYSMVVTAVKMKAKLNMSVKLEASMILGLGKTSMFLVFLGLI